MIYRKMGEGLGQIIGFAAMDHARCSDALVQEVAAIVSPYMVPRKIHVMPALPKNANGKIDRPALAGFAEAGKEF